MVGLVLLAILLLTLPFAIRAATKPRDRGRGLRWQGIKWTSPDSAAPAAADTGEDGVARALARQRAGDLDGALAEYDRALALGRTSLVLNNRGCALLEDGQPERALDDLREAVALDPENATAQCSLAEAQARTGNLSAALQSLRRAVALDASWLEYARSAEGFSALRGFDPAREWLAGGRD
jgi:tetratricopeptide (TPR) repeat protein